MARVYLARDYCYSSCPLIQDYVTQIVIIKVILYILKYSYTVHKGYENDTFNV